MDRRRARQTRGLDNDHRILEAAIATVADRGVDGFGLRDVAAAAGLTHGALYARYANTGELLADTWAQRLLPELERLATGAHAVDEDPRGADASARLASLLEPSAIRRALVEVLIATPRIGELSDVVPVAAQSLLVATGMLASPAAGASPVPIAAPPALGILALALGAVAHSGLGPSLVPHAASIARWVAAAQGRSWAPPVSAPPTSAPVVFTIVDDDRRGRLMDAAVRVVAHSGVAGASLRRIYRASGYTQAAVYTEYGNLPGLIADLVDRATAGVTAVDRTPGRYTVPDVLAARLAWFLSPDGQLRRRLALELFLLAAHDAEVGRRTAAADAASDAAVAVYLLPDDPEAAALQTIFRQAGRQVIFGAAVFAGLVPGLSGLDWRPAIGGLLGAVLAEQGIPEGR